MIDQSVERNVEKIAVVSKGYLSAYLPRTCVDVVQSKSPPEMKMAYFKNMALNIGEWVVTNSGCRNGCSHCCHQMVAISDIEAKEISKAINRPASEPDEKMYTGNVTMETLEEFQAHNDRQIAKYMGVVCPFLKEGRCSIYEVRPLACMLAFNLSDDPTLCDLTIGAQSVPNLDFSFVWAAVAESLKNRTFADIRAFFPEGSGK